MGDNAEDYEIDEKRTDKKEKRKKRNDNTIIWIVVIIVVVIVVGVAIWWCFSSKQQSDKVSAPTGLTVSVKSSTITLNWNAVSGASGYNVYVSTSSGVTLSNFGTRVRVGTNTASLNLSPGTYYFAVSTLKMCGLTEKESALSEEVSATTPNCPNTNLVPPSALNVEDIGGGQVELEWPGVLEAAAYNVYRAQGRAVTTSDFDQVFKSEATELLFTGLASGSQQSFIVTTLDSCGKETGPSPMATITVDCAAPAVPEITNSVAGASTVTVSWGEVDGAKQYVAYVKQGNSVSKNSYNNRQVLASSLLSFTFTNLTPGTTYALGISSANDCGESALNVIVTNTSQQNVATKSPKEAADGERQQQQQRPQIQKPKQQVKTALPAGLANRGSGSGNSSAGLATNRVLSQQKSL
jgi:hypothetical protein